MGAGYYSICTTVIPANAGISLVDNRIPASAGMTLGFGAGGAAVRP